MACFEARLAANRANALKSTGPRTEAGKEASRRNSLRHGLTGAGVVVPGEDAAEVARESAALVGELAGDGSAATRLLAERVATLTVRLRRSERHEFAATAERTRIAAIEFDAARAAEADRLFGAIDEGTNRDELLAMPEGLDRVDAALAELRAAAVRAAGDPAAWSRADSARLARCVSAGSRARAEALGRALDSGDPSGLDPGGVAAHGRTPWASDQVVGLVDAERERLGSTRPGLDHAGIDRARAAAVDLALVDDSPETLRARRYEAATERAIHQALREIRRWRQSAPAEALAPAPHSPPTRDTLADPSYGIPARVVREAERVREMRIGLPPLGTAAAMPALGSICPAGLGRDGSDIEAMEGVAGPAPRGRSRYEDRRKRPKLGR